jgi:phosphoenolpyruvate carboxylase
LRVRSPFVDPLNVLQIELLASQRAAPSPRVAELLAITVNGISAGMKNTG